MTPEERAASWMGAYDKANFDPAAYESLLRTMALAIKEAEVDVAAYLCERAQGWLAVSMEDGQEWLRVKTDTAIALAGEIIRCEHWDAPNGG